MAMKFSVKLPMHEVTTVEGDLTEVSVGKEEAAGGLIQIFRATTGVPVPAQVVFGILTNLCRILCFCFNSFSNSL